MFAQALTFAALAGVIAAQSDLKINTPPGLTLCEPSLLTWEGGVAPYIVSVIPGGQQSAPALKYLSQGTDDHKFTWKVDIEAGTQVTLKVLDNTGYAAFSAPVSIQGTDRSCLGGGESAAPSASGSEVPASENPSASEAPASESPSEAQTSAAETSAQASPSPAPASGSPSPSPSPATGSGTANPSGNPSAPATSPAATSPATTAAATSATKPATSPSPSPAHNGASANVASFGVLAAAGALAALF